MRGLEYLVDGPAKISGAEDAVDGWGQKILISKKILQRPLKMTTYDHSLNRTNILNFSIFENISLTGRGALCCGEGGAVSFLTVGGSVLFFCENGNFCLRCFLERQHLASPNNAPRWVIFYFP